MTTSPPFDLHTHGTGGFVTFELSADQCVAVQLIALDKATLRQEKEIALEFSNRSVHINGCGLNGLFDLLVSGRVKALRRGQSDSCHVNNIAIFEE